MKLSEIKISPILESLQLLKIPDSKYFEEYSNYISNSRLSLLNPDQGGSPEKFFNGFTPTYSDAFSLGSNVHALILQNDLFQLVEEVNKPTAKLGAIALFSHVKDESDD